MVLGSYQSRKITLQNMQFCSFFIIQFTFINILNMLKMCKVYGMSYRFHQNVLDKEKVQNQHYCQRSDGITLK